MGQAEDVHDAHRGIVPAAAEVFCPHFIELQPLENVLQGLEYRVHLLKFNRIEVFHFSFRISHESGSV